ncbi:MAG: SdiA-regulated domain-containing protein [Gammaproteobacteria bacterium]|nr:SdiA-regulated domain-containing protein [Gammaproteobacteria bacterium]
MRLLATTAFSLFGVIAGCQDSPAPEQTERTEQRDYRQWKLPGRLTEISGLAFTHDGRLLAHNDERGVIYELDFEKGRITNEFKVAKRADFEGIATVGDDVFLITSSGTVVRTRLDGSAGEIIEPELANLCEIEGLATRDDRVIAVCKNIYDGPSDVIRILFFDKRFNVADTLDVRMPHKIRPSGIEWDPKRRHYLIVAADRREIVTIDEPGRVIATQKLKKSRHRQPEGIAISESGKLFIADEGGKGKGRLTVYPYPTT